MNPLTTIWRKPVYLPYLQPALTEAILRDAEEKLGYRLPVELIDLLKIQNGGYLRKTLPGFPNEQIYGIGSHFPSLTEVDWTDYQDWMTIELNGLIPFDGDGHWYLCLDYRKNAARPRITYLDTELDSGTLVADSFADYLSQLVVETSGEQVILTESPIEEVAKAIEKILAIRFEAPDSFAHGYPVYRSTLSGTWIWLSPNTVPNGFVRKGEDRYQELIELAKGEAVRFPEIDKNWLLLSFSDEEAGRQATRQLKSNGLDLVPLTEYL